jgi:hypothetical protein
MKTRNQFEALRSRAGIMTIALIALAIIGCSDGGNTPPPAHVHQWGEWVQTKAPTTTEEGEETRTCTTCGEKETRPVDKLAEHVHQWGDWVQTKAPTTTEEGEETRTCTTCGEKETRPVEQTEPTKKEFTVNFLFQNPGAAEAPYQATVMDSRTNCGSQNLEQLKVNDKNIVTIIEEAIQGAFTLATTNSRRSDFRNVFKEEVTIYVENTATAYKMKATDNQTIYFHIDYLKSNSTIQQNIFDTIGAMAVGGTVYPYIIFWFDTPRTLTFGTDCKVTIKSDDQFTSDEWDTLCDKVVEAIMRGYNKDMGGILPNVSNKNRFEAIFTGDILIVLLKAATYDIEIKTAGDKVIYIKTSALDTVDIQPAVFALDASQAYHN